MRPLLILIVFLPAFAYAAITEGGVPLQACVTCYAPGHDPDLEGPFETSRPGPQGGNFPRTLDDFRLGKSNFVTLASNPDNYRKWYSMGTIEYVSNIDGRRYTITNVVGYVHDTGSAFRDAPTRWSRCSNDVRRNFDIAYGDYRQRGGNVGLVNSGPLCGKSRQQWTQIGGPIDDPTVVTEGPVVADVSLKRESIFFTEANRTLPKAFMQSQIAQAPSNNAPSQTSSIQPSQFFPSEPQQSALFSPYSYVSPISNTTLPGTSVTDRLLSALSPSISDAVKGPLFDTRVSTKVVLESGKRSSKSSTTPFIAITSSNGSGTFVSDDLAFATSTSEDAGFLSTILNNIKTAAKRVLEILQSAL